MKRQTHKTVSTNHNTLKTKGRGGGSGTGGGVGRVGEGGGGEAGNQTDDRPLTNLKPVLNWANVCSPEHASDTSTNYDSFLN